MLCGHHQRRDVDGRKELARVVLACTLKHSQKYIGVHQGGMFPIALEVFLLNAFAVELSTRTGHSKRHRRGDASPNRSRYAREDSRPSDETGQDLVEQVGPVKRAGDAAERAAHEDEGTDAIWVLAVVFEGDLNTHRVRGDDWPLDAKLVADASEVAREVLDRQLLAVDGRPTPTMSAKMPVEDSMVAGESGSEIAPGKAVTADSISQNDGGLTLTELFEEEAGTICRVDKALAVVLHAR